MYEKNEPFHENESIKNEILKLKLSAEFGAHFDENEDSRFPANLTAQFLSYIQQFEEASARKESKKIKELLGYPTFKPTESLTEAAVSAELSKVKEYLNLHQINLDVIYQVPDREVYRFITEELMEEQLDVFGVPGMTSFFIYEEFYPNHEEDIKKYSNEFLNSLLNKDFEYMRYNIAQKMTMYGNIISAELFVENAQALMEKAGEIILPSTTVQSVSIENDKATVNCEITFDTLNQYIVHKKQKMTASLFYYKEYDYWYMNKVVLRDLGFY